MYFKIMTMALDSLRCNKLQSFLAMIGIIIGVGSVITIYCLGESLRNYVVEKVESLTGGNIIMIYPGYKYKDGVRTGRYDNLTEKDGFALLNQIESVTSICPMVWTGAQIKYHNRNTSASIQGVATTFFHLGSEKLDRGRIFSADEVLNSRKVAVIGQKTAKELFLLEDPIGKLIRFRNMTFQVIGTLKKVNIFNQEDVEGGTIIIPYTTLLTKISGRENPSSLRIDILPNTDPGSVIPEVQKILRRRHHLTAQTPDDFNIQSAQERFAEFNKITMTLTAVLGGIAAISLLVGGIGIMNIMLITVTERVREIGIRKAIGAKDKDIMLQFLLESVVLTLSGGAIGTIGALTLLTAVGGYFDVPLSGIPTATFLSVSFSTIVGVFFGFWPSKKAASMEPVECLRHE
jgi:putative ABC transport system permease protein